MCLAGLKMTGLGYEQPAKPCGKAVISKSGDAESDATPTQAVSSVNELAAVVTNWATLSRPVQLAILSLVQINLGPEA